MKKPRKHKAKAKSRGHQVPSRGSRARAPLVASSRSRRSPPLSAMLMRRGEALSASVLAFSRQSFDRVGSLAQAGLAFDPKPAVRYLKNRAQAISLPYSHDEREVAALLFLPFLILAAAMGVSQSVRQLRDYVELARAPVLTPAEERMLAIRAQPLRPVTALAAPAAIQGLGAAEAARLSLVDPGPVFVSAAREISGSVLSSRQVSMEVGLVSGLSAGLAPVTGDWGPVAAPRGIESADAALAAVSGGMTGVASLSPPVSLLAPARAQVPDLSLGAAEMVLAKPVGLAAVLGERSDQGRVTLASLTPAELPTFEDYRAEDPSVPGLCVAAARPQATPAKAGVGMQTAALGGLAQSLTPEAFGLKLAEAARVQTEQFVVYNDAYRQISYPMGDVPSLFGVCTDVIVRAYRAVGIDLQSLVQQTKSGKGDRNIDHRRTEVLRNFFERQGASLPITSFAEDYLPGDIVTYHRPQNDHSRSHIAMVSAVLAPSGRPMIIHNRGWGPQLEDGLFVDQITGHYRFSGAKLTPVAPKPGYAAGEVKKAEAPASKTVPRATSVADAATSVSKKN